MSPSPLHKAIVDRLADYLLALPCATGHREYATKSYGYDGYIDLLVDVACATETRIAIEAELTADRVGNDLIKGYAVGAGLLVIATPTAGVARACQRKISRLGINPPVLLRPALNHFRSGAAPSDNPGNICQVLALPLGPALTQLRNRFPARNTCLCISKRAPQTRNAETHDATRHTRAVSPAHLDSGRRHPDPDELANPPPGSPDPNR